MNVELQDLIEASDTKWNEYISQNKGKMIDLSFLILEDKELSNRKFIGCDFTSVQLKHINFDGSCFENCRFESAGISFGSFVGCEFVDCIFLKNTISQTIFRDTKVIKCNFKTEKISESKVLSCCMQETTITDFSLQDVEIFDTTVSVVRCKKFVMRRLSIKSCEFRETDIARFTGCNIQIGKACFYGCEFSDGTIRSGKTSNSAFDSVLFHVLRLKKCTWEKSEILQSQMRELDLKDWNLSETLFVGTHFDRCIWPDMNYRITVLGKIKLPKHLPVTPVQDLSGIDPILRRTMRDTQYLQYVSNKCRNPIKKFFFCCWGITSGYGQSMIRLFATLLVGTIVIGVAGLIKDQVITPSFTWDKILQYLFTVFLKVIDADSVYQISINPWIVFMAQLFGLVWFGLLIGIAATKLSQLGAD